MGTPNHNAYSRFRIFHFLWLIFILFHMAISSPGWTTVGNDFLNPSNYYFLALNFLVILFSIASLLRPDNLLYFVLAIGCLTAVKLDALPSVPNHIILTLIVHLTLLLSLLLYRDTSLEFKERVAQWFNKTAPYLRIELLILYTFVVLHKLNFDYFNPSVSCATDLYTDIASYLPLLPQGLGMDWIMIGLIFLVELAIPLLLIIPATRLAGVMTGLIFHFLLSLHPNLYILSFTAELYALYVLFLPPKTVLQLENRLEQFFRMSFLKKISWTLAKATAIAGALYLSIRIATTGSISVLTSLKNELPLLFLDSVHISWIAWCLFLIGVAAKEFYGKFSHISGNHPAFFRIARSPLLIFPLLAIFNGISPYIGLKTATNFSMFSNLRVDGRDTNHLFIPSRYQLSNFQKDKVRLLSSNSPYLQGFIDRNEQITYFELSRFLFENRSQQLYVTFLRNGEKQRVELPSQQTSRWGEFSWLAKKLLIFRGVPQSGSTPCQW